MLNKNAIKLIHFHTIYRYRIGILWTILIDNQVQKSAGIY